MENAPNTTLVTDEVSLATVEQTLTEMLNWTTDSIQYVKRRNHLSRNQKETVYKLLNESLSILRLRMEHFQKLDPIPDAPYLEVSLNEAWTFQAKINRIAQFYEIPVFVLPDSIPFLEANKYWLLTVGDDSLAEIMWKDDELMCTLIEPSDYAAIASRQLIVVEYRHNGMREPRRTKIGWFGGIEPPQATSRTRLILTFDSPRLKVKQANQMMYTSHIVRIYKVETISRNAS